MGSHLPDEGDYTPNAGVSQARNAGSHPPDEGGHISIGIF